MVSTNLLDDKDIQWAEAVYNVGNLQSADGKLQLKFRPGPAEVQIEPNGAWPKSTNDPPVPEEVFQILQSNGREISLSREQEFMLCHLPHWPTADAKLKYKPRFSALVFQTDINTDFDVFKTNTSLHCRLHTEAFSVYALHDRLYVKYHDTAAIDAVSKAAQLMGAAGRGPIFSVHEKQLKMQPDDSALGWSGFRPSKDGWVQYDPALENSLLMKLVTKFTEQPQLERNPLRLYRFDTRTRRSN